MATISIADKETLDEVKALVSELETQHGTLQTLIEEVKSLVGSSSGGGGIKSVQRGVITFEADSKTATATISAVDTSKAFVLWGGSINDAMNSFTDSGTWDARVDLTNSTTVTATKYWKYESTLSYQVVEFN